MWGRVVIAAEEICAALDHPSHVQRGDLYRKHVPLLLAEIERLTRERATEMQAYATMLQNLTDVQARCTQLKQETRDLPLLGALTDRIATARMKHPKGPNLRSLMEEVGEVASAMRRETPERVRDELLDVATVAMRLAFGEGSLA